ncbi:MAG: rhodanese-like domain-containing protein [Ignavibacteria bacterium]|nr:rhodanese-like domain-containing protein [Ignavibacteria bacterium]
MDYKTLISNVSKLILISFVLGSLFNFVSPRGVKFFSSSPVVLENSSTLGVSDISIKKALELLYYKQAVFIDARNPENYEQEHLPDAINIPYREFDNHIEKVFSLPKDTIIVTYCEGINCNMSHELAKNLAQFGFKKVYVMKEGISEWSRNSYPLVKVKYD